MPEKLLSEYSARRLMNVVDTATDAVERGADPSEALAKAAAEHGLPAGHVALAVRGYNTGRLARQLAASSDPWERASGFTRADPVKVAQFLRGDGKVEAAPATDYTVPPIMMTPAEPVKASVESLAQSWGVSLDQPQTEQKSASDTAPAPVGRPIMECMFEATSLLDKLADGLRRLSPGQRIAVKYAAERAYPVIADFVFARLTKRLPGLLKEAEADPSVPDDHPLVGLVARLDEIRREPKLVKKAAGPETKNKGGDSGSKLSTGFLSGFSSGVGKARNIVNSSVLGQSPNPLKYLAGGTPDRPKGLLDAMFEGVRVRDSVDQQVRNNLRSDLLKKKLNPKSDSELPSQLDQLEEQVSINEILTDPRFKGVDPTKVLASYSTLSKLAPAAMRSPAVAGDLINRQLQTGPLSYYDINQLLQMEHTMAKIRNAQHADTEED